MGTSSEVKPTLYKEVKKLHVLMKICNLHITRNRVFVKGDRNIKPHMIPNPTTLKVSNISMTLSLALNLVSSSSAEKG